VAVEINGQPDRLDLDDDWARRAKGAGVTLTIATDAHAVQQLGLTRYGVAVARRAWPEPRDVLNALPLPRLLARRARRRAAA
jgi:DNA polymerase (family 10)